MDVSGAPLTARTAFRLYLCQWFQLHMLPLDDTRTLQHNTLAYARILQKYNTYTTYPRALMAARPSRTCRDAVLFPNYFAQTCCNMVEWFWWHSSLISTTNWFPSVLWHCWFCHLACKNHPRDDLLLCRVGRYTLTHSIISPLVRLYFRVGNFNCRSLSWYVNCLTVKTNLVASCSHLDLF